MRVRREATKPSTDGGINHTWFTWHLFVCYAVATVEYVVSEVQGDTEAVTQAVLLEYIFWKQFG
jgi:hypothetical protein